MYYFLDVEAVKDKSGSLSALKQKYKRSGRTLAYFPQNVITVRFWNSQVAGWITPGPRYSDCCPSCGKTNLYIHRGFVTCLHCEYMYPLPQS